MWMCEVDGLRRRSGTSSAPSFVLCVLQIAAVSKGGRGSALTDEYEGAVVVAGQPMSWSCADFLPQVIPCNASGPLIQTNLPKGTGNLVRVGSNHLKVLDHYLHLPKMSRWHFKRVLPAKGAPIDNLF